MRELILVWVWRNDPEKYLQYVLLFSIFGLEFQFAHILRIEGATSAPTDAIPDDVPIVDLHGDV